MKAADRSGAPYVLVLGERDIEAGVAQVKTMSTGEQQAVPLADLTDHLTKLIQQNHTKENQ